MRLEIGIRDQRTRKHIKTITIEGEFCDVETALYELRKPVLRDIADRIIRSYQNAQLSNIKNNSDFFDSKGKDISYREYFTNELDNVRLGM